MPDGQMPYQSAGINDDTVYDDADGQARIAGTKSLVSSFGVVRGVARARFL